MIEENEQQPLVSVVIITYNSEKTVIETLDSVKSQTYKNIELIISDDGSKDETVKLCSEWLEENKSFFVNTKLLTVENNSGTPKNINRGIRASKGEWIKPLAGDDKLSQLAIERFVYNATSVHGDFFCSDIEVFCDEGESNLNFYIDCYEKCFKTISEPLKKKQRQVLTANTYLAPGWFYSRDLYNAMKGYDETYLLLEDWPFICMTLYAGYDIIPINEKLVQYRIVSHTDSHKKITKGRNLVFEDAKTLFYKFRRKKLLESKRIFTVWNITLDYFILSEVQKYGEKSLYVLLCKLLHFIDPMWYGKVVKHIIKKLTASR